MIVKSTPDPNDGTATFAVSDIHIRIRLWDAGPPRVPTDWYILYGNFPKAPVRERVSRNHEPIFDQRRDAHLLRMAKSMTDFGIHGTETRRLYMDITVPHNIITELESG